MTLRRWFRLALGYMGLLSLQLGVWALLAPRSFFDDFPGAGRAWVGVDGPYNEHLVRDVGALNLAVAVVIGFAAVSLSRQLVRAAAAASLTWGLPHLLYHLFNSAGLSTSDVVASLGALALFAAIPVMLLATSSKLPE